MIKAINIKFNDLSQEQDNLINAMVADLEGKNFANHLKSIAHFTAQGKTSPIYNQMIGKEHFITYGCKIDFYSATL